MKRVEVFTDGACSWEGVGGWAWWISDDVWDNGSTDETTNQRMEMFAALKAIEYAKGRPILILSDSAYVVNCFRDGWYRKWRLNGWKNGKGQDVANKDLWVRLLNAVEKGDVEFKHVKGHSGNIGNDKADVLAVEARLSREE